MQRDLAALSNQSFDLLVIGGGIQGAWIAWEAALRGLSVALVEQADFASGTSANSLKVIHGGLRYLQTADFQRMRQSIRARQTLMRIAPHLVHPLPVLVPTYGHGPKGKEALMIALKMNDWISSDRNLPLKDRQKHIPSGQILSKQACLEQLPDLPTTGLTGAARFHDAQVYNSEQLVLAFVQSAAQRGAQVANYVRVVSFQTRDDRVIGAVAKDQLTGDRFDIQADAIINASGPWIGPLITAATGIAAPKQPLTKAMNLVVRPLFGSQLSLCRRTLIAAGLFLQAQIACAAVDGRLVCAAAVAHHCLFSHVGANLGAPLRALCQSLPISFDSCWVHPAMAAVEAGGDSGDCCLFSSDQCGFD